MIIDVTGIELTPGNRGRDCLGNGRHFDERGKRIECCCDECDYYLCCLKGSTDECKDCDDSECPRSAKNSHI
ncbi:MAG: hypothetical protein IJE65_05980 [Clostridia bacterium]|nr:hypothetical protein [Clostridia bacterium]